MGQCGYLYPLDGARCLYDDHRLADGEICTEHKEVIRRDREAAKTQARAKAKRDARREGLKEEAARRLWAARLAEMNRVGGRTRRMDDGEQQATG